jgi:hypothetical protein
MLACIDPRFERRLKLTPRFEMFTPACFPIRIEGAVTRTPFFPIVSRSLRIENGLPLFFSAMVLPHG